VIVLDIVPVLAFADFFGDENEDDLTSF